MVDQPVPAPRHAVVARLARLVGAGRLVELLLDPPAVDLGRPLAAEVVAPALQHGEGEGPVARRGHGREVLLAQLVLEGLGGRGHDDLATREHGRHHVGQRLAGAGAGLDHQVPPAVDGPAHGLGHLELARPLLPAAGQGGGDPGQGGGDVLVAHSGEPTRGVRPGRRRRAVVAQAKRAARVPGGWPTPGTASGFSTHTSHSRPSGSRKKMLSMGPKSVTKSSAAPAP